MTIVIKELTSDEAWAHFLYSVCSSLIDGAIINLPIETNTAKWYKFNRIATSCSKSFMLFSYNLVILNYLNSEVKDFHYQFWKQDEKTRQKLFVSYLILYFFFFFLVGRLPLYSELWLIIGILFNLSKYLRIKDKRSIFSPGMWITMNIYLLFRSNFHLLCPVHLASYTVAGLRILWLHSLQRGNT